MMKLRKLCNSDGVIAQNYVTNIDGIEVSLSNNSHDYEKASSK